MTETESNHYDVFNLTRVGRYIRTAALCERKNVNYESDVNSTASDGAEEVKSTHMRVKDNKGIQLASIVTASAVTLGVINYVYTVLYYYLFI